jgi:hypothetical protein
LPDRLPKLLVSDLLARGLLAEDLLASGLLTIRELA